MRVLCCGAGAVGSLLAVRLAHAGHDVLLLGRSTRAAPPHGTFTLRLPDGTHVAAAPRIAQAPAPPYAGAPAELVILATKSYDTGEALESVAGAMGPNTLLLTVHNGLGNEEAAARWSDRVVAGSFTLSVSLPDPGRVVQHTRSGGLALADTHPGAGQAEALAEVFRHAGLRVCTCPNWRAMKWSKLLLNLLANATCAILQLPPRQVLADPRLFRLEQTAFREARRTMRRLGLSPVNLPGYPVRLLCAVMTLPPTLARAAMARRAAEGRGEKLPSLAIDLVRGRGKSEVDALNGAVARIAAECGGCAPVN
ncbi:MAG: 2-dehydropantoate 2-reductase, partial [Armatimonadota bacterium]|nr:2-dehydropantoate 2-reductase [Armatimonadota bacterium]